MFLKAPLTDELPIKTRNVLTFKRFAGKCFSFLVDKQQRNTADTAITQAVSWKQEKQRIGLERMEAARKIECCNVCCVRKSCSLLELSTARR